MTDSELQILVAEAIDLSQTIAKEEKRLKELEAELITEAKARKVEQMETAGGGWSVAFRDIVGQVARITKPANKLKGSISPLTEDGAALIKLVGDARRELFKRSIVYHPVENFRLRLGVFLKEDDVKKVLKLATSKSSMAVAYEVKEAQS